MPVRTRSQRAAARAAAKAEAESSSSAGSTQDVTQNTPAKPARKSRTSQRTRPVSTAEHEAKSEESSTKSSSGESEEVTPYRSNVDEFRQYVQNILDSPNKVNLPKKVVAPGPSPRIERITIQHQRNQQMEFLIPPKQQEEPMEIRQQIRSMLSPDSQPLTDEDVARGKSKSPSIPFNQEPVFHEQTKLWSPNTPSYDQEKADRVSRFLMIVIFTILSAVVVATFQDEITEFLKTTMLPLVESIKERGQSIWENIMSFILSLVASNEDVPNSEDETIRSIPDGE